MGDSLIQSTPQLDIQALRKLMSSIGGGSRKVGNPQVEEYEFRRPCRFTPAQRHRLRDFAELVARNLTATMSAVLRGAFQVQNEFVREEYLRHQPDFGRCYYVPLLVEEQIRGYLQLPVETVFGWVNKILGGMEGDEIDPNRRITSLESDLLLNITQNVMSVFSAACLEFNGPQIDFQREVLSEPIDFSNEDAIVEFVRIGYRRKLSDEQTDMPFSVLMLSTAMQSAAGYMPPPELNEEQTHQRLLEHIHRVPMHVTVRLDQAEVLLRDIATLEKGDVLLLQRMVSDPVEAIVCDKTIMLGQPVRHHGHYGLQVQEVLD
jgi:flagellar motor switch protein FliM